MFFFVVCRQIFARCCLGAFALRPIQTPPPVEVSRLVKWVRRYLNDLEADSAGKDSLG